MRPKFADTYFYIALLDRRDQNHGQVTDYICQSEDFLVTSRWVLTEVANALCETPLRKEVWELLRFIEQDADTVVVKNSDELYIKGLDLFAHRVDKAWSLTDCISFVVMEEQGLKEALTGDRHFEQAGFLPVFKR